MTLIRYRLGDLIEKSATKNINIGNKYNEEFVRGISNSKEFMETRANLSNRKLDNFLLVPNNYFAFNRRTTRMGEKFAIAYNNSSETYIVTNDYVVFRVINENILLPSFLFIYFNRPEFDRHVRWDSWGSSTEFFNWEQMCDVKIDLPPLDIQKKYVAIYKAMLENQESYEKGLEDLKLACDGSMDKLKENYKLTRLKKVLKIVDIRNKNLDIKDISGLNIEKRFIKSNSNVNENGLKNYKIVKPDELVFSGMQTGRDKCIRIALNTTNNNLIVSPAYNVFSINKNIINSKYLMLWFSRDEVDRYGWFISDSSIRSNLDLDRFYEIEIPLPPIAIQNSIANIYKVYTDRKEINEKLKERLKNICPILIKGAVEEAKRKEA